MLAPGPASFLYFAFVYLYCIGSGPASFGANLVTERKDLETRNTVSSRDRRLGSFFYADALSRYMSRYTPSCLPRIEETFSSGRGSR